jgi:uncharacterized membrane protein (UPF0127 family)
MPNMAWLGRHVATETPAGTLSLVNESTSAPIADRVELAASRSDRRRGLLGRSQFEPGAALVIVPCFAIHTIGMRYPIDVVFVNRQGVAVRILCGLSPWRLAAAAGARAAIELPAGTVARTDLRTGDRVSLVMHSGTRLPLAR